MTEPHDVAQRVAEQESVHPIGAWVISGFLMAVSLAVWLLVAVLFVQRS